jgi:hypothetical protein
LPPFETVLLQTKRVGAETGQQPSIVAVAITITSQSSYPDFKLRFPALMPLQNDPKSHAPAYLSIATADAAVTKSQGSLRGYSTLTAQVWHSLRVRVSQCVDMVVHFFLFLPSRVLLV